MRVAPMTSRFLDACRRRPTDVRPVWFMRQAGRYMKQYRQIREKHGILEICKRPDLAATVTLQPIEMLDVDAAIIFADLLLPIEPMGLKLKYEKGEGPVIGNPVRTSDDVDALSTTNTDDLGCDRGVAAARRAVALQHDQHGPQQDRQIDREAPMADIPASHRRPAKLRFARSRDSWSWRASV